MNLKNIALAGAALCGTVFCTTVSADGIESANIVGYSTSDLVSNKSNMQGINFVKVDGTDFDLNADITIDNLKGGVDATEADAILVWDATKSMYTTFYYYYEVGYESDAAWYDANFVLDPALSAGSAFWFRAVSGENKAITIAGAVESDNSVTYNLVGGKSNMIINPYPTQFDLNDADAVEVTNLTGGVDATAADAVLVWDATKSMYTTFYYYYEAGYESDAAWYDANFVIDPVLSAGTAFWYRAVAGEGKAITFKKTY